VPKKCVNYECLKKQCLAYCTLRSFSLQFPVEGSTVPLSTCCWVDLVSTKAKLCTSNFHALASKPWTCSALFSQTGSRVHFVFTRTTTKNTHAHTCTHTQAPALRVAAPPSLRHVPHFGYVSLFPLLMKLLPPESAELGATLEHLANTELLWTRYGLRCGILCHHPLSSSNVIILCHHPLSSSIVIIHCQMSPCIGSTQSLCHFAQVPVCLVLPVQEAQHPQRQALLEGPGVGEHQLLGGASPETLCTAAWALPGTSTEPGRAASVPHPAGRQEAVSCAALLQQTGIGMEKAVQ